MAFPFEPNCLVRRQSYGIPLDIQSFCLFWLLRICTALSKKLSDHVPFCVPPVYTPPVPRLNFRTVELLASLFFPGRFATAARHFENWKLSCPFLSLGGRMRKSRQARKKRKEKEREEVFFSLDALCAFWTVVAASPAAAEEWGFPTGRGRKD